MFKKILAALLLAVILLSSCAGAEVTNRDYQMMGSVEIPAIGLQATVLEGTEQAILRQAAGHFPGCGSFGSGNYCIAAHSSPLYKEYFNPLKNAETGMEIRLYNVEKDCVTYIISEMQYVAPSDTWVLDDFGDDRITLITCNDDGSERLVVTGMLRNDPPA